MKFTKELVAVLKAAQNDTSGKTDLNKILAALMQTKEATSFLGRAGITAQEMDAALQETDYLPVPFYEVIDTMKDIMARLKGRHQVQAGVMEAFFAILELSTPPNGGQRSALGRVLEQRGILVKVTEESTDTEKRGPGTFQTQEETDVKSYITDLLDDRNDDPFFGRAEETDRVIEVLHKYKTSNVMLLGEPGVGKSAIVEQGLAQRIVNDEVPEMLKEVFLLSVDVAGMLSGATYRGAFEKRFKDVFDALEEISEESRRPIIVFLDEFHTLIGTGSNDGNPMNAQNMLKPYLTRGRIKFIGATTADEYRRFVESDRALARRFQQVKVDEPSIPDTIRILGKLKPVYEQYHHVKISREAISSAANFSAKYITERFLPDKAISLLDETCAAHHAKDECGYRITSKDVEDTLEKLYHIPKHAMEDACEKKRLKNLKKTLTSSIFGQDEAIGAVAETIQFARCGLADDTKPTAAFFLVGPSGVGKTELAKQVSAALAMKLVRFDMSEYQESHSVAKLTGAPAGYVGYGDGGLLTEAVRKTPRCVLLFDEIEKAHPDIHKLMLQILDHATLTDSKGRKADFRNSIIMMTSNCGATTIHKSLGFGTNAGVRSATKEETMAAVSAHFPPEFRNRLDSMICFNGMSREMAERIAGKELKKLQAKLIGNGISFTCTEECLQQVVKEGISAEYGAREMQRTVTNRIGKLFLNEILNGKSGEYTVTYTADGYKAVKVKAPRKGKVPAETVSEANIVA